MVKTEQFYKAIIASSNDAVISKSLDGIITSWNQAAEDIFGYSENEIVGQSVLTLFPEERVVEEQQILSAIKRGDSVKHYKTQRRHKDGHLIDIMVTVSPILAEDGIIIGASKIVKDISQQVQNEKTLKRYAAIVSDSEDAIVSYDRQGNIVDVNRALSRLTGFTESQLVGRPVMWLFDITEQYRNAWVLDELFSGNTSDHFRSKFNSSKEQSIAVSVSVSAINDVDGKPFGGVLFVRDIRKTIKDDQQLAHYQSLVESSEDAIISKSLDYFITSWNKAAERLFGYTAAEIIGKPVTLLFPPERLSEEKKLITSVRNGKPVRHFRTVRLHKNGQPVYVSVSLSPIYDENHELCGFSKIVRDISSEIKQEQEVWHLANYDSLTGLLNRTGIQACIEELVQLSMLRNRKFAIFYVDLDGFKYYNDHFGHEFGDKLLTNVATQLKTAVRQSDEVGRLGGDEFVICMMGFDQSDDVKKSLANILQSIHDINQLEEVEVNLSASIGVAIFPEDGRTCQSLLSRADHAMYSAKEHGKDTFEFYSGVLETALRDDNSLVKDLRLAIRNNGLQLYYQPIFCARSQLVSKVEALVRWNHPKLGFVPPDTFVPLAEKYGLVRELDAWVCNEALSQLARWTELYGLDFQMSLNKSPFELMDEDTCISEMVNKLHEYGTQTANVVIEITEHALVSESLTAGNILRHYHELGLELAIDDFGTGYSSLAYLKYFPIKYLKLDKNFVGSFLTSETDKALVEGILSIATNLDIKVVAEGVETREQYERLVELDCDYIQGFYFAKPMPAEDFEHFMCSGSYLI
ncbi:sensor domain-containing protein [Alteromonas lipolytica]|uniref:Diguanylate cyclase n=1 Tax=Alteromonas lipolytica TaxID=1856405 RepID=A0A1E8FG43_9ALTE|nr:PAS domain S-box protein [Alteromonas lipolytica]OFI34927.1 hypothetical protein BFC17_15285 [Alteromonas lipolytica]GGF55160.1 GGDEF domain-containing protein [Alteromonas lipolytica]